MVTNACRPGRSALAASPGREIAAGAPVNRSYRLRGRRYAAGSMPNPDDGVEPAANLPCTGQRTGQRRQPRRSGRQGRVPERWLLPRRRRGRERLQASQRDPEAPFVQPHDSPLCDLLRVEVKRRGRAGSVKYFTLSRKKLAAGGPSMAWGRHMAEKFSGPGTNWQINRGINRRPGRSEAQVPRSRDRVSAHRADG
jgi:hypothetical protein